MKVSSVLHFVNCMSIGVIAASLPLAVGVKLVIAVSLALSCGVVRSLAAAGK